MEKQRLVAESIEDFYGQGYTSSSTGENKPNYNKELQSEIVEDILHDFLDFDEILNSDEETIDNFIVDTVTKYAYDLNENDPENDFEVINYARNNIANIAEEVYIKVLQQRRFHTKTDNEYENTQQFSGDKEIPYSFNNKAFSGKRHNQPEKDVLPKRGWATYHALMALEKAGAKGMKYVDLVRVMYDAKFGEGAHKDYKNIRGYLSGNFRGKTSYGQEAGAGPIYKYADKINGRYIINDSGRKYLQNFKQKIVTANLIKNAEKRTNI